MRLSLQHHLDMCCDGVRHWLRQNFQLPLSGRVMLPRIGGEGSKGTLIPLLIQGFHLQADDAIRNRVIVSGKRKKL